ncbi:MAG TPA: hypothetical protein VD999_04735 [Vitreimonas sp.]|nr:hypothetical protein [Vitreimonas sp.]
MKKLSLLLLLVFILSRSFIWVFKPPAFSEIIYSYMPYAHLWASGVTPYLEQWYEYPPATIPLFYIPHWIDKTTHGFPFHLNYSHAYRAEMLLIDVALFTLMWKVLRKLEVNKSVFVGGLLYYIVVTTKAHHFLYDTMDLAFAAAVAAGLSAPLFLSSLSGTFWSWAGFALAVALKYVNAPLALLYGLAALPTKASSQSWATYSRNLVSLQLLYKMMAVVGGIALVWLFPLLYFRSSLMVSLVYQQIRGLQIDSTPAVFVRVADRLQPSEHVIEVYKNYEIAGPISTQVLNQLAWIFPVSIGLFLLIGIIIIGKNLHLHTHQRVPMLVWLTLGYFLVFMLTGKVLSRPFLFWHLPLLAFFPFKILKHQLAFTVPSTLMIWVTLSQASNDEVGFLTVPILVGLWRVLMIVIMSVGWVYVAYQYFWLPVDISSSDKRHLKVTPPRKNVKFR